MVEPRSTDRLMQNRIMNQNSNRMTFDTTGGVRKFKLEKEWLKNQLRRPQNIFNGIIMCIATIVLVLAEFGYLPATKIGFFCNDPLFSHKYRGEVITPEILGVTAVFLPLLVFLLTEYLNAGSWKNANYFRIWHYFTQCLIGGTFALGLTEMGKVIVGEHRPHFFDTCRPDTAANCTTGQYIDTWHCTSTEHTAYFLVDSSRSFPSGHSSVSVFVGLFSSYVIHTGLPTNKTGHLMRPFLMGICLTWSLLCALTRITDRRHHWWDVLIGSVLGGLCAVYFMRVLHKKLKTVDYSLSDDADIHMTSGLV